MPLTLILQQWTDLGPLLQYGPTVVLLGLVLIFILKAMPTWKEVRLRELDLRSSEVHVRGEEAKALTALSETLHAVAVEQRRAADTVKIMQRINARSADDLSEQVAQLNEQVPLLNDRLGSLERHYGTDTSTATKSAAH